MLGLLERSIHEFESRAGAIIFSRGPAEVSLSMEWSLRSISENAAPQKDIRLFLSYAPRHQMPPLPLSLKQTDMETCWIKDQIVPSSSFEVSQMKDALLHPLVSKWVRLMYHAGHCEVRVTSSLL
jgi:hypothetical protein